MVSSTATLGRRSFLAAVVLCVSSLSLQVLSQAVDPAAAAAADATLGNELFLTNNGSANFPVNLTAIAESVGRDAWMLATVAEARKHGCVTKAEIAARIQSFADAVPAISQAFWTNGGGADGTAYAPAACQAAYAAASAALDGAYAYDGKVLFKPTLTTGATTFRPTRSGALSYFIGTQCLRAAGSPADQFPAPNSSFYEYGFALSNYNGGTGFVAPTVWDPKAFYYRAGWENCDAPLASGPMCFTAAGSAPGSGPCVDKTFGFNREKGGNVVITAHHSSAVVPGTTTSTTLSQ